MMLYNHLTLCQEGTTIDNYKEIYGVLKLPDLKHITKETISLETEFNPLKTNATLFLKRISSTGIRNPLGSIKIAGVPANCGAIMIHELYPRIQKNKIGTHLLTMVEDWTWQAGYSMIYGNIPEYKNHPSVNHLEFFLKRGYSPMGKPYLNKRSGNINHWFMKLLEEA